MPARAKTTVEDAVFFIHKNRLATQLQLADGLNISSTKASDLVREGRRKGMLRIAGKGDRGQFQYVAMIEWPSGAAQWAQAFANRVASR